MHSGLAPHQKFLHIDRSPDEWITGTETMTIEQKIYLKTLCEKTGERFDTTLSKASAAERIRILERTLKRSI